MSEIQRSLAHLNWLCWLQEADYDVWLILLSYIQPIIDMRKTHKEIRYFDHPIFKKVCISLIEEERRRRRSKPIFSVTYKRWYNGNLSCEPPWQVREMCNDSNDLPIIYGIPMTYNTYDGRAQINCVIRETKDKVIDQMIINDIPYKKSWTKQKLMNTIMKHHVED